MSSPALARHADPTAVLGPYVLVVDDHQPCLDLMRALLETSGHCCEVARSGADALICSDRRPPGAVITDLQMPGLDGEILGRWLKARYPGVPLLLLTGKELNAPDQARLRACFDLVLQKPIDPATLLASLDHLLGPHASGTAFSPP